MSSINYQPKINLNKPAPQMTPSPIEFRLQSDVQDFYKKNTINEAHQYINVVTTLMDISDNNVRQQAQANEIINHDQDKIWFATNVAFVFGIGAIYDENDARIMDTIINYFDSNQLVAHLENHYRIESYDDSLLIQEIEKKLKIQNGNYHVFMVPIVYANDDELEMGPEEQFRKKGIVKKFTTWDQITDYMSTMMSRYGLISTEQRLRSQTSHEIGSTDLPHKPFENSRDINTKFKMTDIMDADVLNEIDYNLSTKNEMKEDYAKRNYKRNYIELPFKHAGVHPPRKNLYQQIAETRYTQDAVDSKVDPHVGVEGRINDRILPPQMKVVEYQLWNDNDAYEDDKGWNNQMDAIVSKTDMPRFAQAAIRGGQTNARSPAKAIHYNHELK